jgi:hypothetical protein
MAHDHDELSIGIAFGYTKTFDLNEIMQCLLSTPKHGSTETDAALNMFVLMTYDPPPAYYRVPPFTSDRQTALDFFGVELTDPPANALDICIDGVAKRIADGERFIWGTA